MDINDLIRRFLGVGPRGNGGFYRGPTQQRDDGGDDDDDLHDSEDEQRTFGPREDGTFVFRFGGHDPFNSGGVHGPPEGGPMNPSGGGPQHPSGGHVFDPFGFFDDHSGGQPESFSFGGHFGDMDRQMEEMVRGFGVFDSFFKDAFSQPGRIEMQTPFGGAEGSKPSNPRDFMLKAPDASDGDKDINLDDRIAGGIDSLFVTPAQPSPLEPATPGPVDPLVEVVPRPAQPGFFSRSFGSSVYISTIVGKDGKVEEKRTVRDSSGREETIIKRKFGDQSHSVTSVTTPSGEREEREEMCNLDTESLDEFKKKWEGRGNPATPDQPRDLLLPDPNQEADHLFKKLFTPFMFTPFMYWLFKIWKRPFKTLK